MLLCWLLKPVDQPNRGLPLRTLLPAAAGVHRRLDRRRDGRAAGDVQGRPRNAQPWPPGQSAGVVPGGLAPCGLGVVGHPKPPLAP